jgi:hypothetical protein
MYDNLDRSFLETSIHNMMEERKIFAIEKTSTRHMLIHIAATTKNSYAIFKAEKDADFRFVKASISKLYYCKPSFLKSQHVKDKLVNPEVTNVLCCSIILQYKFSYENHMCIYILFTDYLGHLVDSYWKVV